MIHWLDAKDAWNSPWIVGSATWTIEKSMTSRKHAMITIARMIRTAKGDSVWDLPARSSSMVDCFMFSAPLVREPVRFGGLAMGPGGERRYSPASAPSSFADYVDWTSRQCVTTRRFLVHRGAP